MSILGRAIAIAAEAHASQTDKAGRPYILHPLRVMMAVPDEAKEVAVLHDVLEDCPGWTLGRLEDEGFGLIMLNALAALTRGSAEEYDAYIERVGRNPIARIVKLADLADNLSAERVSAARLNGATVNVDRYIRAQQKLGRATP